jgi:23S rRNA pseudouridine2604 synthase
MCETFGYKVKTLKRIRIMHIQLGTLPTGKWRYLTPQEMDDLEKALEHAKG